MNKVAIHMNLILMKTEIENLCYKHKQYTKQYEYLLDKIQNIITELQDKNQSKI